MKQLEEAGIDTVMESVRRYVEKIKMDGTEEKYIMHGSTFFNGSWRDYVSADPGTAKEEKQKVNEELFDKADNGTEFLVHPNSGELYKVVDGVMYNKRGKKLNEAGYVDLDFGLSKGGLF